MRLISTTATTASSTPTRIDPIASGVAEPVSWCAARPAAAIDQPDQRGGVLGEHGPQGGVGRRQHVLDEVPYAALASARACRTDCRNENPSSTNDTASTTYPMTKSLAGSGSTSSLDAVGDRHRGTGDEQPERREQRPDVGLPAVAERVRVRRAGRRDRRFGDQQEDLVAGVRPGVGRLGDHRRRAGHHRRQRLRHRDQDVGAEGDQHRRQALGLTRRARLRHGPEQVEGSPGGRRADGRRLLAVLLMRHRLVLTHFAPGRERARRLPCGRRTSSLRARRARSQVSRRPRRHGRCRRRRPCRGSGPCPIPR